MRIAFLVDVINEKSGARAPIKIIEELHKLGVEIQVFSYHTSLDPTVLSRLKKEGVEVTLVDNTSGKIFRYFTAFSLLKHLKKADIDLIACHSSLPFYLAAKFSGKPVIYTYYGTQLLSFNNDLVKEIGLPLSAGQRLKAWFFDKLILFLEKIRIVSAEGVIGISKSTALEVKKLYGQDIPYIYLGADLDEKVDSNNHEDPYLLLSVSRIVPYKGFHRLISIFQQIREKVPQAKLVIVGTNHHQQYLDYLYSIAPEGVSFHLNVSDQVLKKYYQNCSMYISATTWEGFGMPFLEAQNYGKPVVGLKNTSIPEVINNNKTGYVATSEVEFADKVIRLLKDKKLKISFGQEAFKFAKKFNWEQTAKEYQKYFEGYLIRKNK